MACHSGALVYYNHKNINMRSKMPDDDMDYMDWSYKIYQDKKKINAVLNKLTDKDLEILGLSRESFLE